MDGTKFSHGDEKWNKILVGKSKGQSQLGIQAWVGE
jgi:hypothetical protein